MALSASGSLRHACISNAMMRLRHSLLSVHLTLRSLEDDYLSVAFNKENFSGMDSTLQTKPPATILSVIALTHPIWPAEIQDDKAAGYDSLR